MSMSSKDSITDDNKNSHRIDEREDSLNSFSNMRKGFLVKNASGDRRKKLCDEVDIQSEPAVSSHIDREIFNFEEAFYNY